MLSAHPLSDHRRGIGGTPTAAHGSVALNRSTTDLHAATDTAVTYSELEGASLDDSDEIVAAPADKGHVVGGCARGLRWFMPGLVSVTPDESSRPAPIRPAATATAGFEIIGSGDALYVTCASCWALAVANNVMDRACSWGCWLTGTTAE